MNKKFFNTWTPVVVFEKNEKISTKVWGREYIAGGQSFLERIISQNIDILGSPVRVSGTENDRKIVWQDIHNYSMNESDDERAVICSSAKSNAFVMNVTVKTEFDGCMDIGLAIMPQGRSVNQCFGLGDNNDNDRILSNLYIDIPISKDVAKFYHFFPNSGFLLDEKYVKEDPVKQADFISGHMQFPFKEQVLIDNDDVGIAVFFESDIYFQPEDENKCIEIFEENDVVVLRYHLLDSEPYMWMNKGCENGIDLYPLTFRFGLQVTPVKEFPQNPYTERNLHIDCFKKIAGNYEDFLFEKHSDTEIMIDRYKRLGVNTLYIHEKWNDIQNSPLVTKKTAERLKLIVSEAHKRGIRVIPYFGYEISTLSPYFAELGERVMYKESEENYAWYWYRFPYQRAPIVCYKSEWQDIFVCGIEKLINEFDFDGIYLDGTIRPMGCINEKHGCGYRDKNGKLHKTYPIWAVRELMKKLYRIINSRGGVINCHGSAAFSAPVLSFCHSIWEGEQIQAQFMHGELGRMPEGHYRAVFAGRNIGVPLYMLCYSNPPIWNFSEATAISLPIGVLPKPVDSDKPLEEMSEIWNLIDEFDMKNSEWKPYYLSNVATVSDSDVKLSFYEKNIDGKKRRLVFLSNTVNKKKSDISINFTDGDYRIIKGINICTDKALFDFEGIAYKAFIAEII